MNQLVTQDQQAAAALLERAVVHGDLSQLNPQQRTEYYVKVCESVGLNPLTKPFEYMKLNGKEVLYAKRDATDQLRKLHHISAKVAARETFEGVHTVTVTVTDKTGRFDESTGSVSISGLKGDALANAFMKAETKAKRRATLSICGLGMLDESELETISHAHTITQPPQMVTAPKVTVTPIFDARNKADIEWLKGQSSVELMDELNLKKVALELHGFPRTELQAAILRVEKAVIAEDSLSRQAKEAGQHD